MLCNVQMGMINGGKGDIGLSHGSRPENFQSLFLRVWFSKVLQNIVSCSLWRPNCKGRIKNLRVRITDCFSVIWRPQWRPLIDYNTCSNSCCETQSLLIKVCWIPPPLWLRKVNPWGSSGKNQQWISSHSFSVTEYLAVIVTQ